MRACVAAVMAIVASAQCARAQQYGTALGSLKGGDVVVTEQALVQAVGIESAKAITNQVAAGYLCTVAAANNMANAKVSPAQLDSAVEGVLLQIAPLASTSAVAVAVGAVESALNTHTANEQIHLTLNQAARIAGAVQAESDPIAIPRVELLEEASKRWNAAAAALGNHTNNGAVHLTPAQASKIDNAITNETDLRALCAYHYGSTDIVPNPTNWFTFAPVDGGYAVTWFYFQAGRTNVVMPYEFYGGEVVEIGEGAFSLSAVTNVVAPKSVTRLREYMFEGSTNLVSVTLPSASQIDSRAFYGASALRSVHLPSASSLGDDAFFACISLTNVILGAAVALPESEGVFFGANTNVVVTVTNPQATGWGATWCGAPVVRPALFADEVVQAGHKVVDTNMLAATILPLASTGYVAQAVTPLVDTNMLEQALAGLGGGDGGWMHVTNTAASVLIEPGQARQVYWVGSGDATLTLGGLEAGTPIYLVCQGMDSLQVAYGYFVGGGMFQAGRANHYIVWRYGAEVLVNGITTTAEGEP